LGKERFSSLKKIHVTYLGKQNIDFGEGEVLKLKEDPCSITGKQVWGRKVSQAQRGPM